MTNEGSVRGKFRSRMLWACVMLAAVVLTAAAWLHRSKQASIGHQSSQKSASVPKGDAAKLAKLMDALQRIRKMPRPDPTNVGPTVDERLRLAAENDPVGQAVPALVGVPKAKQLETLKAMMSWPGNKFVFEIPQLALAREMPLSDRARFAEDLGNELIAHLEDQGYRYDLPADFAAGVIIPRPPESEFPQR